MIGDKPLQAGLEKTDLGAPSHHEPARHQPLPPPASHRPGGDVVLLAHFRDCQDRFLHLLHGLANRGR